VRARRAARRDLMDGVLLSLPGLSTVVLMAPLSVKRFERR
jgi:hypothetical protein